MPWANEGKSWTDADNYLLWVRFAQKFSLESICQTLGRSPYATVTQLQRQNLLCRNGYQSYHRVDPEVWVTLDEVRKLQEKGS